MKRYHLIFICLLFFNFSSSAQEETETSLPFVYAIISEDYSNNFYLMDALTGTTLQEFTQDGNDCPIRISENGRWLAYWQSGRIGVENFLLDIKNENVRLLDSGIIQKLIWSSDYELMAANYHYNEANSATNKVLVYHAESLDILFEDNLDTNVYIAQTTIQFVGNELLYATVNSETTTLELYRWDGKDVERKTIEDEIFSTWSSLSFSPNGRYLAGYSPTEIYLVDLETQVISLFGSNPSEYTIQNAIQWLNNKEAGLGYIAEDSTGNFYFVEYNLLEESTEPEQIIQAEYSFSLSPDAANLVYRVVDMESESISFLLMNLSDNTSSEIAQTQIWYNAIQWLSSSQLVYLYVDPATENLSDIFFYDINTGENRQLTNTPEITERFDCSLG